MSMVLINGIDIYRRTMLGPYQSIELFHYSIMFYDKVTFPAASTKYDMSDSLTIYIFDLCIAVVHTRACTYL